MHTHAHTYTHTQTHTHTHTHTKQVQLPSAQLNVDTKAFARIVCAILDIPVYTSLTESLHLLFTLYSVRVRLSLSLSLCCMCCMYSVLRRSVSYAQMPTQCVCAHTA